MDLTAGYEEFYIENGPDSTWIWQNSDGSPTDAVFTFVTTVDLTDLQPSTAELSFSVSVDNNLLDIEINGMSTGFELTDASSICEFCLEYTSFTIDSGFMEGENTSKFIVEDLGR